LSKKWENQTATGCRFNLVVDFIWILWRLIFRVEDGEKNVGAKTMVPVPLLPHGRGSSQKTGAAAAPPQGVTLTKKKKKKKKKKGGQINWDQGQSFKS
jgi:hypothetical protein